LKEDVRLNNTYLKTSFLHHTNLSHHYKESQVNDIYRLLSEYINYVVQKCRAFGCRGQLKCDDTLAETRFRLSAKRTSPFKLAGASVQSTTGSRGLRISGSNAGYTMFRGSVKGTGYTLHSSVSPSLPLPRVNVCHHISIGAYKQLMHVISSWH